MVSNFMLYGTKWFLIISLYNMIFYHDMTLYQIWYCFKTCDIEAYFVILYHIIPYCIISHDTISYYDTISYPNHLGILIGAYGQLNYLNEK